MRPALEFSCVTTGLGMHGPRMHEQATLDLPRGVSGGLPSLEGKSLQPVNSNLSML